MKLMPRISEKSVDQTGRGVYVFEVSTDMTKPMVKKAVTDTFKVKVEVVNMLVQKGKVKTFQRKEGRRSDTKKAYVKLQKGQKIALFEEGKEEEKEEEKK